jgi:hypothetical protein
MRYKDIVMRLNRFTQLELSGYNEYEGVSTLQPVACYVAESPLDRPFQVRQDIRSNESRPPGINRSP